MAKSSARIACILPGAVALLLALSSCQAKSPRPVELTVFAAASLTDAFTEIGQAFQQQNPGVEVSLNFAGSADLALQLSEGARADVFASANREQMDKANAAGRIDGEPHNFATNRLVVIVPADNPAGLQTPLDLSRQGLKLVLAAPDVPVRNYVEEALDKMDADPAYGEGFKAAVLANLVSEEPNVRQVVTKVSLGEADAGIVYSSDVTSDMAGTLLRIEIPDGLNIVASYPIAAIKDASSSQVARSFIDFVLSGDGQAILQKWGFGSAPR